MPGTYQQWEQGSNLSSGVGFVGLSELRDRLKEFSDRMRGPVLRQALQAAAKVYKEALQAAAPVGGSYTYKRPSGKPFTVRDPHIGRLRDNVIIYQRQSRTTLAVAAEDLALLVGFEKKRAYYAYFVEYGHKAPNGRFVPGTGFARAASDGAANAAFEAAVEVLRMEVAA